MKIQVTAGDIAKGLRGIPACCPIALALQRHTGKFIRVFGSTVRTDDSCALLPENVQLFIVSYDSRRPVKPFAFEIEL